MTPVRHSREGLRAAPGTRSTLDSCTRGRTVAFDDAPSQLQELRDGPDSQFARANSLRIQAHVQLCWLALLLMRTAELATGDTWRNSRDELDRLNLVTMATADGHVAQRGQFTPGQHDILTALELPPPASSTSPTSTA